MASFLKLTMLFCIGAALYGKNLGTYGHTYAPEEEDFLLYLNNQYNLLSENEKNLIRNQLRDHYKKQLLEPTPVKDIQQTTTHRTYYVDPTVTAKRDIKDHLGKIIVPLGTTYNPLIHIQYEKTLLFFDGSKSSHLAWAQKQPASHWILIKGKPLALEESEARPVYFDQGGTLCHWLKIQQVPARVTQEGTRLKIEEVNIGEDGCELS